MNEIEFRERFERPEGHQLGGNTAAIDKIILACRVGENSSDEVVRNFMSNFDQIDSYYNNFRISSSQRTAAWGKANQILLESSVNTVDVAHEIGHFLNYVKNFEFIDPSRSLETRIITPTNFNVLLQDAKKNCVAPENKEDFKRYVEHICKDKDLTIAEKGPVSDILAGVFKVPGLRIGTHENECYFPSLHTEFYSSDIEPDKKDEIIFDEIFADLFALKANNCETELQTLHKFLGDDFMNCFDLEMMACLEKFEEAIKQKQMVSKANVAKISQEKLDPEVR